jgi:uncharacterized damage-inducible protein DinB
VALSEIENYLQRIENLRGQIRDLIANLPVEALNWRPIDTEDHAVNSLAVLATHVAGAEHFWIAEGIGRYPATRNREAEFVTRATDAAQLVQLLEKSGQETREILSNLPEAELNSILQVGDRTVPVRWAIVHVIDHTALHLGHMQITYQLWQGGQSARSPRWFERLPD